MDKREMIKDFKRRNEKKSEDMLLQLLKTIRRTFGCDIWRESLADEDVLIEDARCGDSTAQFVLSMYWLLKAADTYYPAAVKTAGLLYASLLEGEDVSAEKGYARLCLDTAELLRGMFLDLETAEALELEGSGKMVSFLPEGEEAGLGDYFEKKSVNVCSRMAREFFEKALAAEESCVDAREFISSAEGRLMMENFQLALELGEEGAAEHIRKWRKYL